MFANSGEMIPPCGVPVTVRSTRPLSLRVDPSPCCRPRFDIVRPGRCARIVHRFDDTPTRVATIVVDTTPLASGHGIRGIGRYFEGVVGPLVREDPAFAEPGCASSWTPARTRPPPACR